MATATGLFVSTPLSAKSVAIRSLTARESVSAPFDFRVELAIANTEKDVFDRLLNQLVTVTVAGEAGRVRYFNGVCTRLTEGSRGAATTTYVAALSPKSWTLAANRDLRIFQHLSVPDILKKLLASTSFELRLAGTYPAREFCVQHRESDLAFASRLMEDEGIFYYFEHTQTGHKLVIGDQSTKAPALVGLPTAPFARTGSQRVSDWQKSQRLTAGKTTLWDSNFELPQQHLEATQGIAATVPAGAVVHRLTIGNEGVERYDFPGGYAKWFDGVGAGGADQPAELQKLFTENKRVAALRMQEEAVGAVTIQGSSSVSNLATGHRLTLTQHFDGNGDYLVTGLAHSASQPAGGPLQYTNTFDCIPIAAPFRPARTTPRPVIAGPQSAVVVGPPGSTIFTDKYGRVKVQFHWDRVGHRDANSSAWIRVAAIGPGTPNVPFVGQEVLVAFEEGDPDQPIIVGSPYGPTRLPPPPT